MTKKTKLIPFNWELYQKGAKAVCRSNLIRVIHLHKTENNRIFGIIELKNSKGCTSLMEQWSENGCFHEDGLCVSYDLFIEVELEEKTFWANVYKDEVFSFASEKEANVSDSLYHHNSRLGTLKVTYTEEDLIK